MVFRSLVQTPRPLSRLDDPFLSMERLLQRIGDGWNAPSPTEAAAMSVRVDVKEDEKAFTVTADLPSLTDKDVSVTFDDGLLTIRGEKKVERDEKKETWHVIERSYGSFARQVALPDTIDADKIEAAFDKGVLKITLPKQPAEKTAAKKISIKSS